MENIKLHVYSRKSLISHKSDLSNGKLSDKRKARFILGSCTRRKGKSKYTQNEREVATLPLRCSDAKSTKRQSYVNTVENSKKRKRRRKRRRQPIQDEACRLQRRARYLLIKIKLEQNLIDAYSADGWRGQSREKIKPEQELIRAEKQILTCKLGIREAIRQLDLLGTEGSMQDYLINTVGSVSGEHISCSKCKSHQASRDNAIIKCNGTCKCGFHQKCLIPPITKREQGWLCKFCQCKRGILEALNAHLGTCFRMNSSWEDIFAEATQTPKAQKLYLNQEEEWPSEDSEDDDYYPETNDNRDHRTGAMDYSSDVCSNSSSSVSSSDEASLDSNRPGIHCQNTRSDGCNIESSNPVDPAVVICSESGDSLGEVESKQRQRKAVDYKKLHDEMFGKDLNENEPISEDEDWRPQRRKKTRLEPDPCTAISSNGNLVTCSDIKATKKSLCRQKSMRRIPLIAVQKLREVFAENELPSKAAKDKLSKELGIQYKKIGKWFRNARYAALKVRKESRLNRQLELTNISEGITYAENQTSCEDALSVDPCMLPLSCIIRMPKKLRRNLNGKNLNSVVSSSKICNKETAAPKLPLKIQETGPIQENQMPANDSSGAHVLTCQINPRFKGAVYAPRRRSGDRRCKFSPIKSYDNDERIASDVDDLTEDGKHYLTEIERLVNLQNKVQNLRKTLLQCIDDKCPCDKDQHLHEPTVMYIPFVVVKEKT